MINVPLIFNLNNVEVLLNVNINLNMYLNVMLILDPLYQLFILIISVIKRVIILYCILNQNKAVYKGVITIVEIIQNANNSFIILIIRHLIVGNIVQFVQGIILFMVDKMQKLIFQIEK